MTRAARRFLPLAAGAVAALVLLGAVAVLAGVAAPAVVPDEPRRPAVTYDYDAPPASMTTLDNARTAVLGGYDYAAQRPRAAIVVSARQLAAKGGKALSPFARRADEFPRLDRTGKVHGGLPGSVPGHWTRSDLEDSRWTFAAASEPDRRRQSDSASMVRIGLGSTRSAICSGRSRSVSAVRDDARPAAKRR